MIENQKDFTSYFNQYLKGLVQHPAQFRLDCNAKINNGIAELL